MLFDDEEQLEVRHVISLAHHDISIYSGGDVTPEGELFIKRNALCLSRKQTGSDKSTPDAHLSKPFYLFSENCSAKEDFYFALLKNQEQTFGFESDPPVPKGFEVKNIISLVQRLHSSEDHVHTRWLNAMIGRVFLAIYKTRDLENFIREKITKKISRVKRPAFLTDITIQKIHTGEAAPYFTNLKLKDLTVEGECIVEADVRYTGNFRIEVGATAKLDLGTRFKAREVNLLLAVVLKRLEGHVFFKVKAPPSNRVWMSFQTMPKLEMDIEPIVSSRQITYTLILRQIENRIKEVFAETLVQPFWDDVPFFKTEHKRWRGGIFQGDDAVENLAPAVRHSPSSVPDVDSLDTVDENPDLLTQTQSPTPTETQPLEKSLSIPVMEQPPTSAGLFGRRPVKAVNGSATSILSTGVEPKPSSPANSVSRSLNIVKNSTDPVVRTETAHAELFKPSSSPPDQATNYMASIASRSQEASPMNTPFGSPAKASSLAKASRRISTSSKDVEHKGKTKDNDEKTPGEGAETAPMPIGRRDTASSAESVPRSEGSGSSSPAPSITTSLKHQAGSIGRNFFARRGSTHTSDSHETTAAGSDIKKHTLAAVTNAAEQARQWGWNAIRRQKEQRFHGDKTRQVDLSQPMGRGQPLPPPGVPLPGPVNGTSRIGGPASVTKRKAVPTSSSVPEQPSSTEIDDDDKEPQRPLTRRQRGASQQLELKEAEQKMLVVAAPNDSQPGTPSVDERANHDQAWADAVDAAVAGSLSVSMATDKSETMVPAPAADLSPNSVRDSFATNVTSGSPLVAVPAANVVDIDDDDDFSGWLEDDTLGDEEEVLNALPAAVTGKSK